MTGGYHKVKTLGDRTTSASVHLGVYTQARTPHGHTHVHVHLSRDCTGYRAALCHSMHSPIEKQMRVF